jgi:hypothetical protein
MNGSAWMRFSAPVTLLGKTGKQSVVDPKSRRNSKSNEFRNPSFPKLTDFALFSCLALEKSEMQCGTEGQIVWKS